MKHTLENGTLKLYFEGELNSVNSEQFEREIDQIINGKKFDVLILDFENLTYISSAGLRIIVRLKQSFENTSLVKVPDVVYEVFEMVGFNNLFKIERL